MLWKSQFPSDSWDAFTRAVGSVPQRTAFGEPEGRRDIALCLSRHEMPATASRAAWVLDPADPREAQAADGAPATRDGGIEALRRSRLLYDRACSTYWNRRFRCSRISRNSPTRTPSIPSDRERPWPMP